MTFLNLRNLCNLRIKIWFLLLFVALIPDY
mgnify:CR=1 FL=1|jgi:hypothetical protein